MQKSNYFANIFMFISKISVWRSQLNAATTIGDAGIKNNTRAMAGSRFGYRLDFTSR